MRLEQHWPPFTKSARLNRYFLDTNLPCIVIVTIFRKSILCYTVLTEYYWRCIHFWRVFIFYYISGFHINQTLFTISAYALFAITCHINIYYSHFFFTKNITQKYKIIDYFFYKFCLWILVLDFIQNLVFIKMNIFNHLGFWLG